MTILGKGSPIHIRKGTPASLIILHLNVFHLYLELNTQYKDSLQHWDPLHPQHVPSDLLSKQWWWPASVQKHPCHGPVLSQYVCLVEGLRVSIMAAKQYQANVLL